MEHLFLLPQHELFDKFLMFSEGREPPFQAQDTLRAWQEKNHPWLKLSDVHKETTEDIRVTVIPFYMGFRQGENQQNNVFWWRYCIRYIVCLVAQLDLIFCSDLKTLERLLFN